MGWIPRVYGLCFRRVRELLGIRGVGGLEMGRWLGGGSFLGGGDVNAAFA